MANWRGACGFISHGGAGTLAWMGAECVGDGLCGIGKVQCSIDGSRATCSNFDGSESQSTPETCDLLDNDCNGETDDGMVASEFDCRRKGICTGTTIPAACVDGAWLCDYSVVPGFEFVETLCDGIDSDCDGVIDAQFLLGEPCDGPDTDQCKNGIFECSANGRGATCGVEIITDIRETCSGMDDDCDGMTDEDFPAGEPCDGPDADSCLLGRYTCTADGTGVECVNEPDPPNPSTAELCDGLDNDCDGTFDNGGDALCLPGQACQGSAGCVCVPDCTGKACGDDGCGTSCGKCTGIRTCDGNGKCLLTDTDADGVPDDGDASGVAGDYLCKGLGLPASCDDNCLTVLNPDQVDHDGDGMGDACDSSTVYACYQETATEANSCGAVGGGSYSKNGAWNDGVWDGSYTNADATGLYVTYVKPPKVTGAKLRIDRYLWESTHGIVEGDLPSQCWSGPVAQLWIHQIRSPADGRCSATAGQYCLFVDCFNGSSWITGPGGSGSVNQSNHFNTLYEEGITWTISLP